MLNPLKRDPSRTTMLRRKFVADMNRRFGEIKKAVRKLIVIDDVFGLTLPQPVKFNVESGAYRFLTDKGKVEAYRKWLQEQIDQNLLTTVGGISSDPWTAPYIESAYKKGMVRAYIDVHKEALAPSEDFYIGGRSQFLMDAFAAPATLSKIELVSTRVFEELRGVTASMSQQLSRELANGLAHGFGPEKIARGMVKRVDNLTRTRARMIARTEVISAHAEGQLDSFARMGIEEVHVMAEWLTAGDNRVCEQCGSMEGRTYTVEEAKGLITLHPNCRCAWIPANVGEKRKRK